MNFSIFINLTAFELVNINVKYVEWHEQANKEIIKSEIVILPYPNDKERLVKSSKWGNFRTEQVMWRKIVNPFKVGVKVVF